MKPIIKVEDISKEYSIRAARVSHDTLRDHLAYSARSSLSHIKRITRRQENRKRRERDDEWFSALMDVSFDVMPGEVVGIIGKNGAGKSTLLKVLSRITEPSSGRIELYGRVGSLLEVGTGFHPELSGRENIYLNGAILGMHRAEIAAKFDEIVAFAEIEQFLEVPVKRYSSGMYMRLAFAVAAQLEPEILLVDEVLAVGDAAFQRKCMGKMSDVAKRGRTVLFVSHNMTAVNQICPRTVMLAGGRVAHDGNTNEVITKYLSTGGEAGGEQVWHDMQRAPGNDRVRLRAVRVVSGGKISADVNIGDDVSIEVEFWNLVPNARNLCANIYLLDGTGATVLSTANTPSANSLDEDWFEQPHQPGLFRATCTIPGNFLNEGLYYINAYVVTLGPIVVEVDVPQVLSFQVFDTGEMREAGGGSRWDGVVRVRLPWRTEMIRSFADEAVARHA